MLKLNRRQLNKLSDIYAEIGIVFFAIVALPAVLDKTNPKMLISGIIIAVICWILA